MPNAEHLVGSFVRSLVFVHGENMPEADNCSSSYRGLLGLQQLRSSMKSSTQSHQKPTILSGILDIQFICVRTLTSSNRSYLRHA